MKYSGIGGQAVMEGIMMRNGDKYAVAVRKPDKEIDVQVFRCKVNHEKVKELPIVRGVFNFIDSVNGRWASDLGKIQAESMGMKWVPILDTEYMMPTDMEEFKQFATAKSVVNPDVMREGIVLRDSTNDFSFKNVSREYLMKHNG